MIDLQTMLKEKVVIIDGAMGTMLQQMGMPTGMCPELFGMNEIAKLEEIHCEYIEAGADIIESNTFGGNRFKLSEYGLDEMVREINIENVKAAKRAARGRALVAGSIGPSGKLLQPMGDATFDSLFAVYAEQASALEHGGADLLIIETMLDIGEMKIAFLAARSATSLPIIAHMTFEQSGRTMTGTDPLTALMVLEALEPIAIGANCSGGAKELLPIIKEFRKHSSINISVCPNAGIPQLINGQTVFPESPEEMAEAALLLYEAGANIIGGCCGSTPLHIQAIARTLKGFSPKVLPTYTLRGLASRSSTVLIGKDWPLAFIGERINPTARKALAQDIREGSMQLVRDEACRQYENGAPILDVNMGVPGINEAKAMREAVFCVQSAVDVPISIDSTNIEALEAGLKECVGRPLINSTTGEENSLARILPLAKKYGAAVLGLCLDENGIPNDAQGRFIVAKKIYAKAKEFGLRDEDIYIDCLVQTASAEQGQVLETLKVLRMIKDELNVGTVLGVSNISHGLPAREIINSSFLAMAYECGLDLPIINPFDERMMETYHAAAVILNRDPACADFIEHYGNRSINKQNQAWQMPHTICESCNIPSILANSTIETKDADRENMKPGMMLKAGDIDSADTWGQIQDLVLKGDAESIQSSINNALERFSPLEIMNKGLIPGIERAGEMYEKKLYFLPQLLMAAEAMKRAFSIVKPLLSEEADAYQGTIVLATVKGDIHDIGKNIVAIMLENYGFKVIDVGKDVDAEIIVKTAKEEKADIIGLSALMTTTMPQMKEVIAQVEKEGLKCKVIVGGAVLTEEYAQSIGAAAYAKDARQAVIIAKRVMDRFQASL